MTLAILLYNTLYYLFRTLEIVIFEKIKSKLREKEAGNLQQLQQDSSDMFEKSFSQLGGDSLSAMQLSSLLREHLQFDIPAEAILKLPLKAILSDLLNNKSEMYGGSDLNITPSSDVEKFPDWKKEASLSELQELVRDSPCCSLDCTTTDRASCVLLTGSTGFLGRFILLELLLDPHISKVYCLIQNKEG